MSEKWKIIGVVNPLNPYSDCICKRELVSGGTEKKVIDMLVSGDFQEGTTSESLIGETVECDYTLPAGNLIAVKPRLIQKEPRHDD